MKKMEFITLAQKFMDVYAADKYSRFRSYDLAHKEFRDHLYDGTLSGEQLAKELFVFLSSWGMLRGSCFLLQKDYLFLVPIIKIVKEPQYCFLMDVDPFTVDEDKYIQAILNLKESFDNALNGQKYWKYFQEERIDKEFSIGKLTDTQVGKILLAVFGCVPAYDRNIKAAFHELEIRDKIDEKGLRALIKWTKDNEEALRAVGEFVNQKVDMGVSYSVMKVIDMITWEYGFELGETEE